jgi:hypothetical protein
MPRSKLFSIRKKTQNHFRSAIEWADQLLDTTIGTIKESSRRPEPTIWTLEWTTCQSIGQTDKRHRRTAKDNRPIQRQSTIEQLFLAKPRSASECIKKFVSIPSNKLNWFLKQAQRGRIPRSDIWFGAGSVDDRVRTRRVEWIEISHRAVDKHGVYFTQLAYVFLDQESK